MRKFFVVIAVICAALVIAGCASTPPASEQIAAARSKAPSGTLVGQATGDTEQKANDNAKYQLARAMSFMVKDMVDASVAAGVLQSNTAETFRQGVNTALGRLNLVDAVKSGSGQGSGGSGKVYWAVYYMGKTEVIKAINQAVNASKSAYPGAAAFSTERYIDQAFATHSAREWKN